MAFKKSSMRGKNFAKKVKEIVREEIQDETENKVAVIGLTDTDVQTASIPTGDVAASANFIKIMPLIQQGTAQYNNRVGNEIRLKSLDIKMLLNTANSQASTQTLADAGLGVRVMILRQKDQNSQLGVISDFQGDKLLENGAIISPGPSSFAGETWNLVQKINREQFSVRYDKVFYLDTPYRLSNSTALPPKTKVMSHTLRFGKQGLKLTFGSGASENPTNFPYIMVIGYASTTSSNVPTANGVRYSYSANANYTDA